MKLSDVAVVRSGLVLSRKQARGLSEIRYPLLNLRSINVGGFIDLNQTDMFDAAEVLSPEYLSQVGDIIVRLSAPYTAVIIDNDTAGLVVSSNFVIIRVNRKEVLPEYLYWFLNTTKIKREIFENSSANMLAAINGKYFSEFEMPAVSIANQKRIADMNMLAIKEAALLRKLAQAKEQYYNIKLEQFYEEKKRGN